MALPFLFEIGCEEIPDWMIPAALDSLRDQMAKLMADQKLDGQIALLDATPRRLVVRIDDLPERQADSEELAMGPPKSSGPGAAAGFARKMGVAVDELQTVQTAKGEYLASPKRSRDATR